MEEKKGGRRIQTVFVMAASFLCVLAAIAFLFIPQMGVKNICYICCVGMIIWGVVKIANYFAAEAFRRLHDYSFATGTMFITLGCVGLVRAKDIVKHQEVFLGLAILAIGIVLLQCAIQLKLVNSRIWMAEMVFSLLILLCSILVLANVSFLMKQIRGFAYWVLMIAGIINLISFPMVAFMIYKDKNRYDEPYDDSSGVEHIDDDDLLDDQVYAEILKERLDQQEVEEEEEGFEESQDIEDV